VYQSKNALLQTMNRTAMVLNFVIARRQQTSSCEAALFGRLSRRMATGTLPRKAILRETR